MPSSIVLAACLVFAPQSSQPPTAEQLVEQARSLLPTTDAADVHFVSDASLPAVVAAGHVLDAAIALRADFGYALWWRGYVESSLGVDEIHRGHPSDGRQSLDRARGFLRQAMLLEDGKGYWTHRALGLIELQLGDPLRAIENFAAAIAAADATIAAATTDAGSQDAAFVKFKARQTLAEAHLRALEFARAREVWTAFYRDYGDSKWNRNMSLAETALRERDFAAASALYSELTADPELERFDASHAALGYLAGVVGDTAAALRHLDDAIELENVPTVYPLLWRWLLAPDDARADARREFEKLIDDLPESVPLWDARLGAFLLGRTDVDTLLADAATERARRVQSNESAIGLTCETWFYIGERAEQRARAADDDATRRSAESEAQEAYERALAELLDASKWEWEYARLRLAELARRRSLALDQQSLGDAPWRDRLSDEFARIRELWWHRAGEAAPRARDVVGFDATQLEAGDLVMCRWTSASGEPLTSRVVVLPAALDSPDRGHTRDR